MDWGEYLDELSRQTGLSARYLVSGVGGLGATFANPIAASANEALDALGYDYRFPDQYEAIQAALSDIGLPEPETTLEKGVGFASELGVPDPTDASRVMAQLSHMIDPDLISQAMTVFHGTPHKWANDRPDMSKIGTGEGAQAYGHGLYFAENPSVARAYQAMPDHSTSLPDGPMGDAMYYRHMAGGDDAEAIQKIDLAIKNRELSAQTRPSGSVAKKYNQLLEARRIIESGEYKQGSLYELDLPDETIDKMLDWDAPLSEQPESVRNYADMYLNLIADSRDEAATMMAREGSITGFDLGKEFESIRGKDFYDFLTKRHGSKEAATEILAADGIPGIRYLDGTSRSAGEGTRNFVIFDDSIVTPLKRNNEPIK